MNRPLPAILAAAVLLPACTQHATSPVPLEVHVGGVTQTVSENGQMWHRYTWPGVYFEARFTGPTVGLEVDDAQNVLALSVDDELQLLVPRAGRQSLTLRGLGEGEHTVRLEKTSETQGPTGEFLGFFVPDDRNALPPPVYARAIEFIGDSFTVGYGDTSTGTECTVDQVRDTTDTSLAFGPLTAKHFDADYRILASSGFGMVRNYANKEPGSPLPVLYERAVAGRSAVSWQPDAIVIWLGTNDFSTELGDDEAWRNPEQLRDDYRASYVRFVRSLQEASPSAHIVLIASGAFVADVHTVASGLSGGVSVLDIEGLDYRGCHWHPSVADHELVAQRLIQVLAEVPALRN